MGSIFSVFLIFAICSFPLSVRMSTVTLVSVSERSVRTSPADERLFPTAEARPLWSVRWMSPCERRRGLGLPHLPLPLSPS